MAKEKNTKKAALKKRKAAKNDVKQKKADSAKKLAKKAAKKVTRKAPKKAEKIVGAKTERKATGTVREKIQKTAIALNLADFMCPCCSKRCPLSKPKCGKGKAIAKKKMEKAAKAA